MRISSDVTAYILGGGSKVRRFWHCYSISDGPQCAAIVQFRRMKTGLGNDLAKGRAVQSGGRSWTWRVTQVLLYQVLRSWE